MSESLKKRIIQCIVVGVFAFMVFSIIEKLINNSNIILKAFIEAIFYIIGFLVTQNCENEKNKLNRFIDELNMAFGIVIPIIFITYVIFKISFVDIFTYVVGPLIISLLLNTEWKD